MRHRQPKFRNAELWGACSRCGARVKYGTLARERLTGMLVCTAASGRPVAPCLDPWPEVFDFQVSPDRSIEPPAEPLPARWMLDAIFSAGTFNNVAAGTPSAYAQAPMFAPDDATRLNALLRTQFQNKSTQDFTYYKNAINQGQNPLSVTTINAANYDGTFVPSGSVRTVTPPDEHQELLNTGADPSTGNQFGAPPWAVQKGV